MKSVIFIFSVMIFSMANAQKPDGYDEKIDQMYSHTVELVTAEELDSMLKETSGIVMLDAREKKEYKVSHIQGARLVGFEQFAMDGIRDLSLDTPIVVYCSLGVRSEQIGERLQKAGFTKVKNLRGGIFDWVYHDLPVVDNKNKTTDKVHAYDENWSQWLLKGRKVY